MLRSYTCECGKKATIIEENKVQDKYWCAGCYLKKQIMSDADKSTRHMKVRR